MDLKKLRMEIDTIDSQLLALLNKRARIATKIGHYKLDHNLSIENIERENEIIEKLCSKNTGTLPEKDMRIIFMDVIVACRNLQKKIIS
jgi:chorismate mutase / prephenate dehydratase